MELTALRVSFEHIVDTTCLAEYTPEAEGLVSGQQPGIECWGDERCVSVFASY